MLTNDAGLAEKIKMIANHGQRVKYHHDLIGVNSRLDTLQAAVLNVKLQYLDEYSSKRSKVASQYSLALKDIYQLVTPVNVNYSTHVYNQYTIKVIDGNRDDFKKYLESKGVPTMIYYPVPLHLQKAYMDPQFGEGSFPVTEKLSNIVLSLPIHTEMANDQIDYICSVIKDYFS